jgi:hypothetical protein
LELLAIRTFDSDYPFRSVLLPFCFDDFML